MQKRKRGYGIHLTKVMNEKTFASLFTCKEILKIIADFSCPHDISGVIRNDLYQVLINSESYRTRFNRNSSVEEAAYHGSLAILKWAHENTPDLFSDCTMSQAAARGHLDCVKWLHKNRDEGCTHAAMDSAAAYGHLEIVVWLHKYRNEGCTPNATIWAAQNGHFHVVMWLIENKIDMCIPFALVGARDKGYYHIIKCLHSYRKIRFGEFNTGQWLLKNPLAVRIFVLLNYIEIHKDKMDESIRAGIYKLTYHLPYEIQE